LGSIAAPYKKQNLFMILFFDTETNGLPDFNKRASDPTQPHIVQLAAILTADNGETLESHNVIVKPDGWEITKELSEIHGITNDKAKAIGLDQKLVIGLLLEMIKKTNLMVAHNVTFDKFMARIAMRRFGFLSDAEDVWWKGLKTFCTMKSSTDICCIPGTGRGHKWPKLSEAYEHFFKQPLENAHDALADVTACKAIYFMLTKGGAK
jgi:DNA polymerase-3 subunit epsilon